jgi:Rps23 Pro-64 3,4-dihydroxylase Tpa1-like proline 4-hydroxylase
VEIEIVRSPVTVALMRGFFGPDLNSRIFAEILSLEDRFRAATVTPQNIVDPSMRTNRVLYMDAEYAQDRNDSALLSAMDRNVQSHWLHQVGHALGYPMTELYRTDWSETQVSWYSADQQYKWHVDRNANRVITLVYYAFRVPRRFRGGEICLTDGVVVGGEVVKQSPQPKILTIAPENDMAVMFSSSVGHRVMPVESPQDFADGRFSVNCWIGFR